MLEALRFLWNAARGSRLRPWKSPYLRWRMETFSGAKAEELTLPTMTRTIWDERLQFLRFLRWTSEMRGYSLEHESKNR